MMANGTLVRLPWRGKGAKRPTQKVTRQNLDTVQGVRLYVVDS